MKALILFIYILSFSKSAFALFGEETALMVELVTTTAEQLNELEQLVTNAEKYTQKMREYNELFEDQYFKAERVAYLAEELASKKKIEDLGDLNRAIRNLKYNMEDLRRLMKEYADIKDDEVKTKEEVKIEKNLNASKKKRAEKQVESAIAAKNAGRASQLTAQNTALIHETQIDMQKTQLEILEKSSTTNRLLAEGMEEKRLEQMEKERAYGIKRKGEAK